MSTKISYDRSPKIVGLGMMPFYRIGPERWFDNYQIISYNSWDIEDNSVDIFAVRDLNPDIELGAMNTQAMIGTTEFNRIINDNNLEDAYFISYRPLIKNFGKELVVSDSRHTETFENKAWFRERMSGKLNFPNYEIHTLSSVSQLQEQNYTELKQRLGSQKLVIQHESLSGGRGTYFANSYTELRDALSKLLDRPNTASSDKVVVSVVIEKFRELSFQACITRYGTFYGPPQRQIVRHPLLVNTSSATADQFCGGIVSYTLENNEIIKKAHSQIAVAAKELARAGYVGVFGMDFLVGEDDELYTIETNARITGMLPLLTQIQSDYPFILLHILEQIDADYTINTPESFIEPEEITDAAFLVLHDLEGRERIIESSAKSGLYDSNPPFDFVNSSLCLEKNSYLWHNYMVSNQALKQDSRNGSIFSINSVNPHGDLGGIDENFVKHIQKSIVEKLPVI